MNETHTRSGSLSRSRPQTPPPRPTTPLRPPSRSSLRSSYTPNNGPISSSADLIASLEPAFAEFSDGMADLEANFMHLQLLHESLARFNECFASFLYGLNVNAYCVDFTETPVAESFQRAKTDPRFAYEPAGGNFFSHSTSYDGADGGEQTFISTDTSFVENPPASAMKPTYPAQSSASTRRIPSAPSTRGNRGSSNPAARGAYGQRGRGNGSARAGTRGRGGIKRGQS